MEVHPDKNNGDTGDFQRLKESFDRIKDSRKNILLPMNDSFLPMDFMGISLKNKMDRLDNMKYRMKVEKDIMTQCNHFYSESTNIIHVNEKKIMEKHINENGIIRIERYEID